MNRVQILIGIFGLVVGTLVYIFDRSLYQTYFLFKMMQFGYMPYHVSKNIFGAMGDTLPTFTHAFSFILLTAGILGCNKHGYLFICSVWFLIDCVFELSQKFSSFSLVLIPGWFEKIFILENVRSYVIRGTFDLVDLVSILLGCGIAYLVLLTTERPGGIANERTTKF